MTYWAADLAFLTLWLRADLFRLQRDFHMSPAEARAYHRLRYGLGEP